jgi:glutaredoxin
MNPVRMYTTQVCPYCVRAKALLKQRGVDVDRRDPRRHWTRRSATT